MNVIVYPRPNNISHMGIASWDILLEIVINNRRLVWLRPHLARAHRGVSRQRYVT